MTQQIVQSKRLNRNIYCDFQMNADVYVCFGLLSLAIIKHSLPLAVALKNRKSMHVDRTPCARHVQVAVVAFVKPTRADLDTATSTNIEKTTQAASRKSHNCNLLPSRTNSTPRRFESFTHQGSLKEHQQNLMRFFSILNPRL